MNIFKRVFKAIKEYSIQEGGTASSDSRWNCGPNISDHDFDYDVIEDYHGMSTHNCKKCNTFTIEDAEGNRLPFDSVKATKHINRGKT